MKILYDNNFTTFIAQNQKELQDLTELSKKLIYYRKVYNRRKKDKELVKVPLLKQNKNHFTILTGLLPATKIIDYPEIHKDLIDIEQLKRDKIWNILRPYQKESIIELLKKPRGILQASTGSGKSIIMIAICKAIKKDIPILIIVPKSSLLLEQIAKKFIEFFGETKIGINYGKGFKAGRIMISSPACLPKLSLNQYKCLLIDECHLVASKNLSQNILKCKKAVIRYGFSATPVGRSDEKDYLVVGLLGKIVKKIEYTELVDQNFLAPVKYNFIGYRSNFLLDKISDYDRKTNSWTRILKSFILENKSRTEIIKELCLKIKENNRNCLIIVERKAHGEIILKELKNIGIDSVEFIHSGKLNNHKAVELFKKNKLQFLIATQLIEVGIDIPNLETIIFASIGKSSIQLIQRLGRGLRPYPDKTLICFDLVDKTNFVLYNHYKQRQKWLKKYKIDYNDFYIFENITGEIEKIWNKVLV